MVGSRREARERALELLYECEVKGVAPADVLAGLPISPDPYAVAVVTGVHERIGDVDGLLDRWTRGWPVARMAWVDRNILRLAAYELLVHDDVPTAVAINEAVELAKRFGTSDDSPRFVNGLLSAVAREVRGDGWVPAAAPEPEAPRSASGPTFRLRCLTCDWEVEGVPEVDVDATIDEHDRIWHADGDPPEVDVFECS